MKLTRMKTLGLSLAAVTALLGAATSQAQTFITDSYTNTFDLGANTADFTGGSAASWIYWYNTPGGNAAITVKYGIDANNQTNTSGALEIDSPFGTGGTQNVFFGTFGNQYGYDFSKRANMVNYSNITFDVKIAPGIQPRTNSSGVPLDFGNIGVGIINSGYGYQQFGSATIPLAASNSWVHLSVPVDITQNNLANVPGLAFDINNYGGYPQFPFTNYLDNVVLKLTPVKTPPPSLSGNLQKPVTGLNAIDVSAVNQYDRDQIITVNDSGYTFVGQSSVTYSWNIAAFPTGTGGNYQQHFFIVNGAPGPYDQAADYNLAQCLFITVQQADNGTATMSFRYKTNEPSGNGMLFNGTDPTNTVSNPNGWPIMPFITLANPGGAVGTWSVTFANTTNVTLTAPGGASTNFVLDAASAALFADPVTLILGGQANNVNGAGKAVVYNSFSATGCATPISENFSIESYYDTNTWKNLSNDPNGIAFVPPGSAYWLTWSLPDSGFSLQDAGLVNAAAASWVDLSPVTLLNAGKRQALIPASALPAGNQAYFRLLQRTFSNLQILFPGETNAPNTVSGKVGTPITVNSGDTVSMTVNAVDNTFHIIPGVVDNIHITTTDGNAIVQNDAALVNGTGTYLIQLNTTGPQTVSATDTTSTNIPIAVSTSVNVN
jgi:hypothetical protein